MDVNKLLLENKALVVHLADRFKPENALERDEFIAAGMIGLWKAIEKFDPAKGKLTTIAWYRINREIINYIKQRKKYTTKHTHLGHIADVYLQPTEKLKDLIPSFSDQENRIIQYRCDGYTIKEISALESLEVKEVNRIYYKLLRKIKSHNEKEDTLLR